MSDEDRLITNNELREALFNIRTGTGDEFATALDSLYPAAQLLFNAAALFPSGVGDDFFWSLDVQNYTGQDLLALVTLYDYDLAQHTEQAVRNAGPPSPYAGMMQNDWTRLAIDGDFSYASLSLAAGYVAGPPRAAWRIRSEPAPSRLHDRHQFRKSSGCTLRLFGQDRAASRSGFAISFKIAGPWCGPFPNCKK
jgi:hypothetical protein